MSITWILFAQKLHVNQIKELKSYIFLGFWFFHTHKVQLLVYLFFFLVYLWLLVYIFCPCKLYTYTWTVYNVVYIYLIYNVRFIRTIRCKLVSSFLSHSFPPSQTYNAKHELKSGTIIILTPSCIFLYFTNFNNCLISEYIELSLL